MMSSYDLSTITGVAQSGWNGDIYLDSKDALALGIGAPVTMRGEALHAELTNLIASWDCEETEDGGVLVYTKPGSKG